MSIQDRGKLPEITLRAIILGVLLSVLLGAANAYLGLFAGLTVSASIPAAVISMGILRLLGNSNVLENNIVQTAASAGESLAAGVIFTLPALVLLGTWSGFDYLTTTLIAGLGGLLGVLFTIPLRRALIVDSSELAFPEGVATAEVLETGHLAPEDQTGDRGGLATIGLAALLGGGFKLAASGMRLSGEIFDVATRSMGSIFYFGSNLSPALLSVGYIVGINIAVLVFAGGAIGWFIGIPLYVAIEGLPPELASAPATDAAFAIWSKHIRYMGVGAMVVGGLWALVSVRKSLVEGVKSGLSAYKALRGGGKGAIERTERDTPMHWVGAAVVLALIPLFVLYLHITSSVLVAAVMAVVMIVAGFLFSAVASYMAGLVGSSNNPISGVTIATILFSALLLLAMLGGDSPIGPSAAILIGGVVCCAAAIGGDNMQDLKAGHVVGATPYKQQIMQVVGVLSAALVLAPVLTMLYEANGFGAPTPEHPNPLPAPQATLMMSVAKGVFAGGLPWGMISIGAAIAALVIASDKVLEKRGSDFRMPVLAVAVGIYLPLELSVPILIGGLIKVATGRVAARLRRKGAADVDRVQNDGDHRGLLFASGLITGEALVGVAIALGIYVTGDKSVFTVFDEPPMGSLPGIIVLAAVIALLYRVARPRVQSP